MESVQKDNNSRHITLHGIDGDGNTVTIKIASQMNAHTGHIQAGTVMKLLKLLPIFFDYQKGTYYRVLYVIYITMHTHIVSQKYNTYIL